MPKIRDVYKTFEDEDLDDLGMTEEERKKRRAKRRKKRKKRKVKHGSYFRKRYPEYEEMLEEAGEY